MEVVLSKRFKKQYQKLPKNIQAKFAHRVNLLLSDPSDPLLRLHDLKGNLIPLKSINVTGDHRALFIIDTNNHQYIFYKIGTHSELYE